MIVRILNHPPYFIIISLNKTSAMSVYSGFATRHQ